MRFAAGVRAHGWELRAVGQRVGAHDLTVRTSL